MCATLAVAVTSCIEDPTALENGLFPISEEEARILGISKFRQVLLSATGGLEETTGEASTTVTDRSTAGELDVELVVLQDCEFGGQLEVDGFARGRIEDGAGFIELEFIQNHRDCAVQEGGARYLFRGAPNIDTLFRLDLAGDGSVEVSGFIRGAIIAGLPGGISTRCASDLTISSEVQEVGGQQLSGFRVKGLACGIQFSEFVEG